MVRFFFLTIEMLFISYLATSGKHPVVLNLSLLIKVNEAAVLSFFFFFVQMNEETNVFMIKNFPCPFSYIRFVLVLLRPE